jgi:hypothetical protein
MSGNVLAVTRSVAELVQILALLIGWKPNLDGQLMRAAFDASSRLCECQNGWSNSLSLSEFSALLFRLA